MKDPMVVHLATLGEQDPDYCELIKQITGHITHLGKDSYYRDCKPMLPFLSTEVVAGGKQIVVHNDTEVLVPVNGRKELVNTLHSTHMSTETMLRATKKKFIWPNMKKDLNEKYKGCTECLLYSKDKVDKNDQVPEALTSLYPG